MASLRKHPKSPFWSACFTLPDGRRTNRSTGTTDKRKAMRIAWEYEQATLAVKAGKFNDAAARKTIADIFAIGNQETLPGSNAKDYLESWLKRKELEAGESTHKRYISAVRQFLEYLDTRASNDLSQITSRDFTGFRDSLAKRVSANTVNVTLKIIRSAFAQAVRDGLIDRNEALRVGLLKRSDKFERRPFTMDELKRILEAADDEWKGLILFGLYTGQRLGDLAKLTWHNLDLNRQEMRLTTEKTQRRQIIPLTKSLLHYLETRPVSDDPEQPLFPRAYEAATDGTTSGRNSKQFYALLVQTGLVKPRTHKSTGKGRSVRREQNELSFHALRHTATSLLKNAGVSDVITRDIIGHESALVSANYTHIDEETKRRALDSMPDIMT